jgi:NAD(P)-dependent dehydrogenase (short-subunit alcohol dehydrogenase family)
MSVGPPSAPGTDRLDGHTCLVTGGAQGIGFATAVQLARRGARVALIDVNAEAASGAARRLKQEEGASAFAAGADVADADAVRGAVESSVQALGPIGVLVNAAGIMTPRLAPVAEMPFQDVQRMLDVHVRGAYLCAQAVLPGMMASRFGRIINISSVLGLLGLPLRSGYAIAKHGINGFTRALAVEVARCGITVNAVAPGYILTETLQARLDAGMLDYRRYAERAPAGRWGLAQEVGHLIAFLALPASGFITGTVIPVDGGYTMRGDPDEPIGAAPDFDVLDDVRELFASPSSVS